MNSIFRLSRLTGTFPLNGDFQKSKFLIWYTAVLCLSLLGGLAIPISNYYRTISKPRGTKDSIKFFSLFMMTSNGLWMCFHNISVIKNAEVIKNCAESLRNGYLAKVSGRTMWIAISMIAIKSSIIGMVLISEGVYWDFAEEAFRTINHILELEIVLQFCTFLAAVEHRLIDITNELSPYQADYLTHFELVLHLKTLNQTYGWQLLGIFSQIFAYTVVYLYFLIGELESPSNRGVLMEYFLLTGLIYSIIYRCYELLVIVNRCTEASFAVSLGSFRIIRSNFILPF